MLKGQKKHIDKGQGKTKHEAPRSVNYRATQNKNNIGATALERLVVYTTGGLKAFHCTNFSLWIDCLLEIRKIAVCFLRLSLPGDCRVTDDALLAETT